MLYILGRFLKVPRIVDRIIAFVIIITIGIGFIAGYSILTNRPSFLDVAMILALIAFLGTVSFSYYIQKRNKK